MLETQRFAQDPRYPQYQVPVGQRPMSEILVEVHRALVAEECTYRGETRALTDWIEYGPSPMMDEQGRYPEVFPEGRFIACFMVRGSSEGHYVHVEVLGGEPMRQPVMLIKLLAGFEVAQAVAASLTRLFHQ